MRSNKAVCDIKSCFLCKACLPEWLELVGLHRQNKLFKKGETIFQEGDRVTGISFIYKGTVKVHKQWGSEKEMIIKFASAGELVGHRGFGEVSTYPVSATALEPVVICFIDTAFFLSTLQLNPPLTYQLMLYYAHDLQMAEQRMRNLVLMDMKGRIADSLLLMQQQFGKDKEGNINLLLSRQDLASFAGTSYESMFRILNELVKDKVIRLRGKSIKVVNESKLLSFTSA